MELYSQIIVWIFCWVVIKGIFYAFSNRGYLYIQQYKAITLYFTFSSLIVYWLFQKDIQFFMLSVSSQDVLLLLIFFLSITSIYLISPLLFTKKQLTSNALALTKMDLRYLFAKSFEIVFQQLLILALVGMLKQLRVDDLVIYMTFSLLFGLLHLPLMKIRGKHFGLYFSCAACISGFFFPYLILHFSSGYIYSYMLHWGFYIVTGMGYNALKRKGGI